MIIYKLKFWIVDDDIKEWIDLWFDVSKITGFYLPKEEVYEEAMGINIFFEGDIITIMQEKHIMKYLLENFVDKEIKNK